MRIITRKYSRKNEQLKRLAFVLAILVIPLLLQAVVPIWSSHIVGAEPCPVRFDRTNTQQAQCDRDNQDAVGKYGMSADDFTKYRDLCEGVGVVSGSGLRTIYSLSTDSQVGSCSNAIVSCYQHHQNKDDCKNKDYLAIIATCNAGNVGASSTTGTDTSIARSYDYCGTEGAALYYADTLGNGQLIANGEFAEEKINGYAGNECTEANGYKYADQKTSCKNHITSMLDGCYRANGGINEHDDYDTIDESKLLRCMAEGADTEAACKARTNNKGTFVPADAGDANTPSTVAHCTVPDGMFEENQATPDKDADCLKAADGKTCIAGTLEGGKKKCGQASTNIIGCGSDQGATALSNVLRIFVIVLTFGVGIAAVASIAYSAIRYAGARDNQSDVSLARERIRNVVIGLLLYGFLIAIANWLVPGGIF